MEHPSHQCYAKVNQHPLPLCDGQFKVLVNSSRLPAAEGFASYCISVKRQQYVLLPVRLQTPTLRKELAVLLHVNNEDAWNGCRMTSINQVIAQQSAIKSTTQGTNKIQVQYLWILPSRNCDVHEDSFHKNLRHDAEKTRSRQEKAVEKFPKQDAVQDAIDGRAANYTAKELGSTWRGLCVSEFTQYENQPLGSKQLAPLALQMDESSQTMSQVKQKITINYIYIKCDKGTFTYIIIIAKSCSIANLRHIIKCKVVLYTENCLWGLYSIPILNKLYYGVC